MLCDGPLKQVTKIAKTPAKAAATLAMKSKWAVELT